MRALDWWLAGLHDVFARVFSALRHLLPERRVRSRSSVQRARRARLAAAAGLAAAAALPLLLWHRPIALIASEFRFEFTYLVMGWTGYTLIALGLAAFVPVIFSIGRMPESRLYSRFWRAYLSWGVSLYLLGFLLAVQVAQIARDHSAP